MKSCFFDQHLIGCRGNVRHYGDTLIIRSGSRQFAAVESDDNLRLGEPVAIDIHDGHLEIALLLRPGSGHRDE